MGWIQEGISAHRRGLEQRCSSEITPCTAGHPRKGLCLPCAPGHPQHDFISWPKPVCSCFTACLEPGTNLPDNILLWLSQIYLLGVILYITLCCQPHLQPGKLTAPAGSMLFPRERAQVRREGASKQPKLGVLGDGWRCVPLSHTCRQCPLVLLPFGLSWEC